MLHLLRIIDTSAGREIARATVEDSGMLDGVAYPLDRTRPVWSRPIPTLPEADQILGTAVGKVVDLQYVVSYGSIGCDELMPCVAGRMVGNDGYAILSLRGIYVVDAASRRLDRRPTAGPRAPIQEVLKKLGLGGPNEAVTSLGGAFDVVARKVAERP